MIFRQHDRLIIILLLIVVTLTVFWQVLGHDYILYDDPQYVFENPWIQHGLTLESFRWAFTATYEANWHPLTWMSHMLDYQIYGTQPAGHHATNLLLHVANVLILFLVLSQMTGAAFRSAFVAALFAIHPLHVESVAWIAERKDVLSAFFLMLTMWAYLRYARQPSFKKYLLVVCTFALGLMSKPMLVSLPLILLMLDWWPLERLRYGFKLVWEKTPLFAMSAASSVITYIAQQHGNTVRSLEAFPISVRAYNSIVAYSSYLLKTVLPRGLAVFYPYPQTPSFWKVGAAAVIFVCISVLAIRLARRRPYLAMGWSWYVVTLIPVIGLVQVGSQSMADRYTYVPLIGIFIAIAWGIPDLWHRKEPDIRKSAVKETRRKEKPKQRPAAKDARISNPRSRLLVVLACTLIFILAMCAHVQVGYWQDSITLLTHATAVTADNYVAHTNLGEALHRSGATDQAVEHFAEAIRINPMCPYAHTDLGIIFLEKRKPDEAIHHFAEEIKLNPGSADAHFNLGCALNEKQKYGEAIGEYLRALQIDPEFAKAYTNMGLTEAAQGRLDEAVGCFLKAVRIRPDMVEPLANLGSIYFKKGNLDEAIIWFTKALDIKPDLAAAHQSLAFVLYQKGEYAKAWKEIAMCRKYGLNPDQALVTMLSQKMPEPR